MPRTFLALLAAMALFFAGSMAFVYWATSDRPRVVEPLAYAQPASPDPAGDPGGEPPVVSPAVAPRDLGVFEVPPPAPRSRPEVAAFALPEPVSVDGIHRAPERMPAPRRKALRDFRLELKRALAELQSRVRECPLAGASLRLDVESVDGGLRVVDVGVDAAGAANEPGAACAESALRGRVIPAASAEPGRRWQISLAVPST